MRAGLLIRKKGYSTQIHKWLRSPRQALLVSKSTFAIGITGSTFCFANYKIVTFRVASKCFMRSSSSPTCDGACHMCRWLALVVRYGAKIYTPSRHWRGLWTWPPWVIWALASNHKLKKLCIYRGFSEIAFLKKLHKRTEEIIIGHCKGF